MLSLHGDPEEELILRQERDDAEERGYPAWAADWCRERKAARAGQKRWTIAERKAFYESLMPVRDFGPDRIYLIANEMRTGEANPPSYTLQQERAAADAERVEYSRGAGRFRQTD